MKKQYPVDIVMTLWKQFNISPWITLEHTKGYSEYMGYFEMRHSKTLARKAVWLEEHIIHRIDDYWTYKYVLEQFEAALAALTHNTVEAATGSLDVYREDHP